MMTFDTLSLLAIQALQTIVLFIIPPFVVARIRSRQPLQWLHLRSLSERSERSFVFERQRSFLSIAIMLTAFPLINCLVSWNQAIRLPESLSGVEQWMQQMEQRADQLLQAFLTYRDGAWWVLLLNLLVLAVLPAIGEELTFRGVIQAHLFKRANMHVAVWLTAFIFSFVHFQFYGFIPRLLLGALLGYALAWSGQLRYSIIMHATNNALSVLLFYLGTYVFGLTQTELDALGTHHTWWLTAISTPLMGVLIYLFHQHCKSVRPQ